ncbi:2-oxoglutarate dehydrogenase E1 [Paenibacillus dendritiformis]|uniref:2-oxoglutarate dehydrogenase E1 n=1 Tax=Paenibacillus dendritiformis TaxID=130049 RepID=UPI001059BA3C|nr:2-oxoglutarate dehydrogenase E1 [Paenibacillus dendritiformis]TDL50918.1 2-oxoglutarate dehydrogenase E1 [Paenibacillus dendritiformis]
MKAITIIQPWATLIALEEKGLETRSWATKYRGELAIHAGKQIDRGACEQEPIKSTLAKHGYTADNLPTGAVLAIANLWECWKIGSDYESGELILYVKSGRMAKQVSMKEEAFGWYEEGRYAWEMADIRQLPKPIPAKGQQGLWNWECGRNENC